MVELLKTHLQKKAVDKIIALLHANPEVLGLEDDHGSSGLTLIAYSGLQKAFVEAIDLKKSFSFHEAIVCGKLEIVKDYLNTPDFDLVNTHSNDGFTPLSLAAFFNRTEIAKALITMGADPNLPAKNPSKVNALHAAIAKENYELCKLFIENEANVNAVQMKNVTPLHAAVHRGNLALVKLLVENKALITPQMDNGDTALLIAEREKHNDIRTYLLGQQH
ncbi:MAG: ankyrin repeat domain-containing protein [Maribacter sp.]|uniref:ankyrin repeat domain-containing protein n=1 Tax=Maribacter sp. TaxID=1897614 RepID=UPI003C76C499